MKLCRGGDSFLGPPERAERGNEALAGANIDGLKTHRLLGADVRGQEVIEKEMAQRLVGNGQ